MTWRDRGAGAARAAASLALGVGLLAALAGVAEGIAWLAGATPLDADPTYQARVRHRRCQFGWDHPGSRCAPGRIEGRRERVVVAVGGSNVMGLELPPAALFPQRLAARLQALEPGRTEVVNMGRACKDSTYVRRCVETAAPARPDVVVVYTGHNDYANWGFLNPGRRIWLEEHARYYDLEELLAHSRVFSVVARRLGGVGAAPLARRRPQPDEARFAAASEVILEKFTANMESLISRVGSYGGEVFLVTVVSNLAEWPVPRARWDQPLLAEPDPSPRRLRWRDAYREGIETWRRGRFAASLEAFSRARDLDPHGRAPSVVNERIRDLGRRHANARVIDLEKLLHRAGLEEGIGCNFFGAGERCDQFHMNARVHRMLANALVRALRDDAGGTLPSAGP